MTRLIAFLALSALLLPVPAKAAATDWTEVQGGAVRLIASGPMTDGRYRAGLEFMLEPGWHTYWRYSGEAGIPPQITTTGSANLQTLDVHYPAPERYDDGFSESIVYYDGIVLPLLVTPEDPGRPVSLSIDLFFGVCSDICVPGDAALSLELTPSSETDTLAERLILRDLEAVPGPATSDDFRVSSVVFDAAGMLTIEAQVGDRTGADLFAAAPEGSFIALPKPAGETDGRTVWTLSTRGLATTDSDNTLRLVLTAGGEAIEHLEPIQPGWTQ